MHQSSLQQFTDRKSGPYSDQEPNQGWSLQELDQVLKCHVTIRDVFEFEKFSRICWNTCNWSQGFTAQNRTGTKSAGPNQIWKSRTEADQESGFRTNEILKISELALWSVDPWMKFWNVDRCFQLWIRRKREWGNRNGDLTGFLIGNGIQIDEILMSSARSVRDYWRNYID